MLKALWFGRPGKQPPTSGHAARQSECLQIDGFDVVWRKSARRTRSLALKIDKQGQIVVMTPAITRLKDVNQFVYSRKDWICRQLQAYRELEDAMQAMRGRSLWFMGEQLSIESRLGSENAIEFAPGFIRLTSRQELGQAALDKKITRWLRVQADAELPKTMAALSQQTGMYGSSLQIRSYSARWGSCRHDGRIQLNWKLIKTPPEVIEYVIIHELSHLCHFNHSRAFWSQVAQHCPQYKARRKWLKENGRLLIS